MLREIKDAGETKLVGLRTRMSFAENTTSRLWREFMPRRFDVAGAIPNRLYSVQIYPAPLFSAGFTMETEFEKWAAVEVAQFDAVPENMETLLLPGGLYAVFDYKGTVERFPETARRIFTEWLPASGFDLDDRPHFEILGEKYLGPNDPESEEEVWIPVRR